MTLIDATFARRMAGRNQSFISISCVKTPVWHAPRQGFCAGVLRPQLQALRRGGRAISPNVSVWPSWHRTNP